MLRSGVTSLQSCGDDIGVIGYHYSPPPPDVLVARFGALVIALDGDGLHLAVLDPRTTRR